VKYTPTWPRSFMPQEQSIRDLVARMKLVPIRALIKGRRLLFCEDSIVRGTQLKDIIERLYEYGATEVHMRPACPPLVFGCKFLNFSRSRSELDLAGRWAIQEIEGSCEENLHHYADPRTDEHAAMVEVIRRRLKLTSLKYQRLEDLVAAIGLPKDSLCTYCWDGVEVSARCTRRRSARGAFDAPFTLELPWAAGSRAPRIETGDPQQTGRRSPGIREPLLPGPARAAGKDDIAP